MTTLCASKIWTLSSTRRISEKLRPVVAGYVRVMRFWLCFFRRRHERTSRDREIKRGGTDDLVVRINEEHRAHGELSGEREGRIRVDHAFEGVRRLRFAVLMVSTNPKREATSRVGSEMMGNETSCKDCVRGQRF